jgi:hypothetical protein
MSTDAAFKDRIEELRTRTGSRDGTLHGQVLVDQIYAHYQHEHGEFHHPRGGEAFYLLRPLMGSYARYLEDYARTVLDDGGQRAIIDAMEDLAGKGGVGLRAPVELGDLRASGHPSVRQGERTIYDRPPHQHRLAEFELRAKSRAVMAMREILGLPVFFMSHGKIMVIPGRGPLNVIHVKRARGRAS